MQPSLTKPSFNGNPQAGSAPPLLTTSQPPVIGTPPPWAAAVPPLLSPQPKSSSLRPALAILLSLCLGLFLADAVVSLMDDSLILFLNVQVLAVVRGLVFLTAAFVALVVYGLMGLTPLIPKRLFLPVTLFCPVAMLGVVPFLIYCYDRLQQVSWLISLGQVLAALAIFGWAQGGLKFRWPLIGESQLQGRGFSWWNLSGFLLVNVFVLLPALVVYLVLCAALAVDHFSDGFVALRPSGMSVEVRKYVRPDGKTIQLIPMSHVAEAAFYRTLAQSFPTNATILMEGVADHRNLLTNKISYKRMATSLGLAEQTKEFQPSRGELVRADVDVEVFTTNTIAFMNLVMLVHRRGLNAETMLKLMQHSPSVDVQQEVLDDLLRKRNRHLLGEIHSRLEEAENLIVPWGAAHMPEIAREIQKSGFRLDEVRKYMVIRFRSVGKHSKGAGKAGDTGRRR